MKPILIVGGYGSAGKLLAQLLLQHTDCELILGGRTLLRAQATADELNGAFAGNRVTSLRVDASDEESLRSALHGVQLVAIASSTSEFAGNVARAAIEAGADYFDMNLGEKKMNALNALEESIRQSGRCFITEGGFHPGVPAALIRLAAEKFDTMESANVGSVIKVDWNTLHLSNATLVEFIEEISTIQPYLFRNGAWKKAGMTNRNDFLKMNFGPPFNEQWCYPMMLEEMRPIPSLYPSLRNTGFFVGGFNWFTDMIAFPLITIGLKLSRTKMAHPMASFLHWSVNTFSRPPFGTLLKLEASGGQNGVHKNLSLLLAHPDAYMFTSIPAAACLLQYLDGTLRKPGLWLQALCVEPHRFLADLQRLGVTCDMKET